jgi:hypothetical protein
MAPKQSLDLFDQTSPLVYKLPFRQTAMLAQLDNQRLKYLS